MWGYRSHFAPPVSPFQNPISSPSVDPDGGDEFVSVTMAREWLAPVLGALQTLTLQATWQGDDDAVLLAQQRACLLIDMFAQSGELPMPYPFAPNVAEYRKIVAAPGSNVASVAYTTYELDFPSPFGTSGYVEKQAGDVVFTLTDGVFFYRCVSGQFNVNNSRLEVVNAATSEVLKVGVVTPYAPAELCGWIYLAAGASISVKFQQRFFTSQTNGRQVAFSEDYVLRSVRFDRYQGL